MAIWAGPRGRELTRIAQVVPDVPSFAVDDGFAYEVPDDLSGVEVGSLVRVPLGGRRVRGFVTAVRSGTPERALKQILARSGDLPVFDEDLLQTARWVSTHYVAPLSTVLSRCAPPNVPRSAAGAAARSPDPQAGGGRTRPRYLVTGVDPVPTIAPVVGPFVEAGRTVMVTAPTVDEAARVRAELGDLFGERVILATSQSSAAERTRAWVLAAEAAGPVIVGTREVTFWGAGTLGLAAVIEEGRRGYKAKQTPTFNVRDVLRRRSAIERFGLLFAGAVPTTDAVAAGVEIIADGRRVWPLVDIADRREDSGRFILERTRAAVASTLRGGGSVFMLANRRGYAAAFRCVRCRELRRCTNCGAGLDGTGTCQRCGTEHDACPVCGGVRFEPLGTGIGRVADELRRMFGDVVGEVGHGSRIQVGTERDLVGLEPADLAVAVDADGLMLAPHYRAGEDALRLLVRMTLATTPGRGRKALVQTALPDHPVMEALRAGRPMDFVKAELAARKESGFPPVGELLAFGTNAPQEEAAPLLEEASEGAIVLGPAPSAGGHRWLVQGSDLGKVRIRLRSAVQGLRDGGWRVRVDADPVDL